MIWSDLPGAPRPNTALSRLDAIDDGGALLLALTPDAPDSPPFKIILLRSGDQVFCYVNRCAHFGVPLADKLEYLGIKPHTSIHCCVHYATYRWQDGLCTNGDCIGESLLRIPVQVLNGMVVVDDAD